MKSRPHGSSRPEQPAAVEQALYSRLRSEDEARRVWQVSEQLTGASFPNQLVGPPH
ncbi:hypothetical protein [Micromonospora sp. NPDC049891]|uniref:hypothetical protein n=1 Tax=Micromonospora sp. NPDC049891 TaxID=3155655 RepID=UPI00340A6B47